MKIRLTFKHPDVTFDALESVKDDDVEHDKMESTFMKFLEFEELLIVEFDTEAKTATVIEKAKAG